MLDYRIDTFLSVCETLNYTRSAELLNISQPAVSQHIRYLEREYQVKLFEYRGKKLYLTAAGRLLGDVCRGQKADEALLRSRMATVSGSSPRMRLGATLTVGSYLLPGPLSYLMRVRPDIDVSVRVSDTRELLAALDAGTIDCVLIEGSFNKAEYAWKVFSREPFCGICAPDHPLTRGSHRFADLLDSHLLVREPGSGTRAVLEHALAQCNLAIEDFSRTTQIGSVSLIRSLVREGIGISFLYRAAVQGDLMEGELAVLDISDPLPDHDITFVWRKESQFQELFRDSFDLLAEGR